MATLFGRVDAFDENSETWEHYTERLGHYFDANGIGDTTGDDKAKRRAILLSVCGSKVYKLMCDLLAPAKPKEKSYQELVKLIQDHLAPKPSEIVQRFKFNNRFRNEGESVAEFVASLRNLAEHCEYRDTLDTMLRDRLVCGIRDEKIQRRLLVEKELTFQKAYEIATSMEITSKNMAVLQESKETEAVHKVTFQADGTMDGKKRVDGRSMQSKPSCFRCGGYHSAQTCRFKELNCFYCKQKGHIADRCPNRTRSQSRGERQGSQPNRSNQRGYPGLQRSGNLNQLEDVGDVYEEEARGDVYDQLFCVNSSKGKNPYKVTVLINGVNVSMEIDTGASTTVVNEKTFHTLSHSGKVLKLNPVNTVLRTYTGEVIPVAGECELEVEYNGFKGHLPAVVISGEGPCLLGRNWLQQISLNWSEVFNLTTMDKELNEILEAHSTVFQEGLGKVEGVQAKIYIDPSEKPRFFKARPVPYALRDKIETELDRLVKEGTVEPVEFSEWATPIVPIVKEDGTIRICGDYKQTINQAAKLDNYPIPKIEDLYATLGGGTEFTKLDLSQAYQQLELDKESQEYTTINTHKGLFKYKRLPYGISSAPGIFQRTMESLLQGIPQVIVRIDDILVTGKTRHDHLKHLEEVLARLEKAGIHLKLKKCVFLQGEVIYLGHRINRNGIQPVESKVRAIHEAPAPTNVKELQAFLGMLNYYACYLQNLSTVLAPLYELLAKDCKWTWGQRQVDAFNQAKSMLNSSDLLVHYDPSKELVLSCDASPYGLGAVLSHIINGKEKPISYASRTLSPAERNYAQVDKEGAAVIFGIKKFHQYLYGQKFKIFTDHKPLLGLFKADKAVPPMASPRIQRWALLLAAYDYELFYREGSKHGNADGLSRLPLSDTVVEVPIPGETILLMERLEALPVCADDIADWTASDPVLQQVFRRVQQGWGDKCPDSTLQPFYTRRDELSTHNGCILWGNRVVVPAQGQQQLLEDLHTAHPGIVRMKNLARSYLWWPGLDTDIESKVKSCEVCQLQSAAPAAAPLHPWEWPEKPWSRIHIDHAGPFMGQLFLIVIDAYSKWIEVYPTSSTSATATIEKLRQAFAAHGLPEMVVSDNGSGFASEEFADFMARNGILHVKTAPRHPSSNGLVERSVRIFKEGMKKLKGSEGTMQTRLSRFLLAYRSTPQTTTGVTPAELLLNRRLRTRLDLIRPELRPRVETKQLAQKEHHDNTKRERQFVEGDRVLVKNFSPGPKWKKAQIESRTGPLSYTVKCEDGVVARRHVDHLLKRHGVPTIVIEDDDLLDEPLQAEQIQVPHAVVEEPGRLAVEDVKEESNTGLQTEHPTPPPLLPRRSQRTRRAPEHLKDFVTEH